MSQTKPSIVGCDNLRGHVVMLSQPELVLDVIRAAAAGI
jgi:hypothetical protein